MSLLSPEQIRKLREAGVSEQDIVDLGNGTPTPGSLRAATTLKQAMSLGNHQAIATPQSATSWDPLRFAIGAIGTGALGILGGGFGAQNLANTALDSISGGQAATSGGLRVSGTPSRVGKGVAPDSKAIAKGVKPTAPAKTNSSNAKIGGILAALGDYPNAPVLNPINIPQISVKDMSALARSIIGKNYAPVLAGYDTMTSNANTQANTAEVQTAGLYDKYLKDIAGSAAAQGQQYDQSSADAGTRGTALQAQMGQNMSDANSGVAAELGKLGIQAAAPANLQQNSNDTLAAQNNAAQETAAQQQYYGQQKQSQSDYMRSYGNTAEGAGISAQSDIKSQLANLLAQIGMNKQGTLTQMANASTDLASSKEQQDLAMQQANAGYSIQGQQANNDLTQQGYVNNTTRYQNMLENANSLDQSNLAWANLQLNRDIGQSRYGDTGAASPTGIGAIDPANLPAGAPKTLGLAVGILGQTNGSNVYNKLGEMFLQYVSDPSNSNSATPYEIRKQRFQDFVANSAASGVDPATLRVLASQYWEDANRGNTTSSGN